MAFTSPPSGPVRSRNLEAALVIAVLVLGLGALGAHFGLRTAPAALDGSVSRAPARASASAQVHPAANADLDLGPGEAEPTLVACPPGR